MAAWACALHVRRRRHEQRYEDNGSPLESVNGDKLVSAEGGTTTPLKYMKTVPRNSSTTPSPSEERLLSSVKSVPTNTEREREDGGRVANHPHRGHHGTPVGEEDCVHHGKFPHHRHSASDLEAWRCNQRLLTPSLDPRRGSPSARVSAGRDDSAEHGLSPLKVRPRLERRPYHQTKWPNGPRPGRSELHSRVLGSAPTACRPRRPVPEGTGPGHSSPTSLVASGGSEGRLMSWLAAWTTSWRGTVDDGGSRRIGSP